MSTAAESSKIDTGLPAKTNGGIRHQPEREQNPLMNVTPPRREDLQPSYAQTLAGESDAGTHGWYGGMSKSMRSDVQHHEES